MSNAGNSTQKVVQRVADVAAKTATKLSPIVEGVVISRNPDGSLNVDDGRGGCIRQAPAANVRVGQRIRIGTEPGLGQQTSLPVVDLVIDPSGAPCPDDSRPCVRLIGGPPCPEPIVGVFARYGEVYVIKGGTGYTNDTDEPYPGSSGSWSGHNELTGKWHLAIDTNRDLQNASFRRASNYTSHIFPPYADELNFNLSRLFVSFDTTDLPADATVTAVTIKLPMQGNTTNRIDTDLDNFICVVPATDDGSADVANWNEFDSDFILARVSIQDVIDAGPSPHADTQFVFSFTLSDPEGGSGAFLDDFVNKGGITRFALLIATDADGDTYPSQGSFTNVGNPNEIRTIQDVLRFNSNSNVEADITYTLPEGS